ncbi:glutathione S-transferase family protein [Consotaella aegiceratis]|uniref:glutathione S-transferase family protein n=1 Tax=Consotaella aegiceratis TaxID=3097961 RepID=UPI002F42F0D2
MRLYYSTPSPFSSKVRMVARQCGVELDCVVVDTSQNPEELLEANPLGKIPALRLDDGRTVYDSRVICEYLDRTSGTGLYPQEPDAWLWTKTFEATVDGILDAMILCGYEARYRPEEKWHQPWVDRQWGKAMRGLATIEASIDRLPPELGICQFAVASMLGSLRLRFAGRWEDACPKLAAWGEDFCRRYPDFAEMMPRV